MRPKRSVLFAADTYQLSVFMCPGSDFPLRLMLRYASIIKCHREASYYDLFIIITEGRL